MGELTKLLANLDKDETIKLVKQKLDKGDSPLDIIAELRKGMGIVGDKFDTGEYFLMELTYSAEIFQDANELLIPALKNSGQEESKGMIIIGTVKGDVHSIGKNIAKTLFNIAGFKVEDLGVEVPPEKFIEAVKEYSPQIVGMSGLLTASVSMMEETVKALKEAGVGDEIKLLIGGSAVTEEIGKSIGADGAVNDANKGVKLAEEWMGG